MQTGTHTHTHNSNWICLKKSSFWQQQNQQHHFVAAKISIFLSSLWIKTVAKFAQSCHQQPSLTCTRWFRYDTWESVVFLGNTLQKADVFWKDMFVWYHLYPVYNTVTIQVYIYTVYIRIYDLIWYIPTTKMKDRTWSEFTSVSCISVLLSGGHRWKFQGSAMGCGASVPVSWIGEDEQFLMGFHRWRNHDRNPIRLFFLV